MQEDKQMGTPPVVTYLTRVSMQMECDDHRQGKLKRETKIDPQIIREIGKRQKEHADRIAGMMDVLKEKGFSFEAAPGVVYAYSNTVEAFEAKQLLLSAGFQDREFQIVLEYTRGWGML
ncbi:MAG: hypothetical protein H6Q66_1278 [Firmicutes bacterium]|nr:hypothetical protein [Bacillota bacterium]